MKLNCRVGVEPLTEEEVRRRAVSRYMYDDAQVPELAKRLDDLEAEIREIGRAVSGGRAPTYADLVRLVGDQKQEIADLEQKLGEARKLLGHNFERREADKFSINKNRQEPE